jgi:hypothetical protein
VTVRRTVREVLLDILEKQGTPREAGEVLILNLLHQEKRLIRQEGLSKLDVSKEPHWLYKDFNVLYRVARIELDQLKEVGIVAPALEAQLERLAPAFTDTEEVRKAMRGK